MKKLFVVFILSLCFLRNASADNNCGPSVAPLATEIVSYIQDLLSKLNSPFICEADSDPNNCLLINWMKWKHKSYPAECQGFFLDEKGNLGSFSKETMTLFAQDIKQNKDQSVFLKSNPDFDRLCPNFKNFTTTQKLAFHSWLFELLAFPESSCKVNINANNNAPTTRAVCLYQLEDRPEIRKWRSEGFNPPRCAVSSKEILTMSGCTGCAFDEYKRKTLKDGTPFGIFDDKGRRISGSYWASQNPLTEAQEKCLEQYSDPKTGRPLMKGGKPLYLSKCHGSNNEWMARYKYFRRIQRFPLCGTELAQTEIDNLKAYDAQQGTK